MSKVHSRLADSSKVGVAVAAYPNVEVVPLVGLCPTRGVFTTVFGATCFFY